MITRAIKLAVLISFALGGYAAAGDTSLYNWEYGVRYKDVTGNKYKASEYDYAGEKGTFPILQLPPYFGFTLGDKSTALNLEGKFVNKYTQNYDIGVDFGRILTIEGNYLDFYHNLKRDTITTSNPLPTGSYAVENLESLSEYGRRYTDWTVATAVKIPAVPQTKVKLSYRQQDKRGHHQGTVFANCGACHFYTYSRQEDRTTKDFKAGIETGIAKIGKLIKNIYTEYSFENRQFKENAPAEPFTTAMGGSYSAYQSGNKFDFTPDQTANIHEVKVRADFAAANTLYGSYTMADHKNADNDNKIKTDTIHARLTNNIFNKLTMTAYYANTKAVNDVDYTYGKSTTTPIDIPVPKSHLAVGYLEGLDLKTSKFGWDSSYRAPFRTTVRLKLENAKTQRDDFAPQTNPTIENTAKLSVLSKAFKDAYIQLRYALTSAKDVAYTTQFNKSQKGSAAITWTPSDRVSIEPSVDYFYGGTPTSYARKELTTGLLASYMSGDKLMFNASYIRSNSAVRNDIWWTGTYKDTSVTPNVTYKPTYIKSGESYTDQSDGATIGASYTVSPKFQLDFNSYYILAKSSLKAPSENYTIGAGKVFYAGDVPELSRVDVVIVGGSISGALDVTKHLGLNAVCMVNRYKDNQDSGETGTDQSIFAGFTYKF